ncbi:MAG: MBOAT family protein [Oscillospiraceae bacterium]|nr:MBOAT family protein [Oscillospiraceae bacterium]MBQ9331627.1 MBOAT family protein [Oscillospiraceae bacterium]
MVFSSAIFLFCFLPAVFLLYRLPFGRRWQNALLACASLVFYAFGNLHYVPLFLLSVLLNYATGLLLGGRLQRSKPLIALNIVLNLGILCVFKYTDFLIGNANALFGLTLKPVGLILPIGISFYTFQGLSYTIDVYRKPEEYSRSFLKLLLYISFFPQLIAGPIVRWGDIAAQIDERVCTPEKTSAGIRRFLVGLGKKLLLADTAAIAADAVFAASLPDARLAWLGGICYSLQIYFDFSGYSDMAIGMGRMFGFSLKENFLFPYTADSIRDFWRKWHISLSTWFREYLYIPLGGSRCSRARAALNRLIVFFCTGLWHGANWTFVLWGLGHGLLSSLEGSGIIPVERLQKSIPGRILCRVYTLLSVMLLFTLFRADTVAQGFTMIAAMFRFQALPEGALLLAKLSSPAMCAVLTAALVMALSPLGGRIHAFLTEEREKELVPDLCCLLLMVLSVLSLAQSGFHPFIYFQF